MTDDEAVAVSPDDGSSDRVQADANQAALVAVAGGISDQAETNRVQADADQVITVERLDKLIETSQLLADSAVDVADSTRQEMQTAARTRRRSLITLLLMVLLTMALLVPLLVITVSGVHARKELKDCVTPGGKCFQDGQSRTANVVIDLERVTILANACSVDPVFAHLTPTARTAAIQKCIVTGLK